MSVVEDYSARQSHSSSPALSSPPHSVSPPHPNGVSFHDQSGLPPDIPSLPNTETDFETTKAMKDPTAALKRRKKVLDSKSSTSDHRNEGAAKPKKARLPRGTGPRALKKKAEEEARKAAASQPLNPPNLNNFLARPTPPPPPASHPLFSVPTQSEKGNHEAIHNFNIHTKHQQPLNPQSRPSSGQNYDPIRSSTVAPRPASPMNPLSTPPKSTASLNATRSPSISSLIDPPDTMRSYNTYLPASKRESDIALVSSSEPKRPRLSSPTPTPTFSAPTTLASHNGTPFNQDNAEAKSSAQGVLTAPLTETPYTTATIPSKKPTPSISKGPSPISHSPKPIPRKEAPPLPAAGSGLLTGSIFGGAGGLDESASEKTAPTVVINVPLTGDHQYVNFTRLAEEKYGFDALHPRLAAQRERLARVAAAGAALEKAQKNGLGVSPDDMSEDLSNDDADNSNVEMSGLPGSKSGEDADKPARKKRVLKEDMYDVDDDFIDDTEQAWEEQAAVSMDGFFVYSGPLVPEGEEPKVERCVNPFFPRTWYCSITDITKQR